MWRALPILFVALLSGCHCYTYACCIDGEVSECRCGPNEYCVRVAFRVLEDGSCTYEPQVPETRDTGDTGDGEG